MRRIEPVSCEHLKNLMLPCNECCYWEKSCSGSELPPCSGLSLCPEASEPVIDPDPVSSEQLVGRILLEDDVPVGYGQIGAPRHFPRIWCLPSGPPSPDAYLLTCLYIAPESRGRGNGKYLLRHLLKELYKSRAATALEAFVVKQTSGELFDFYLSQGFRLFRDNPRYPLLRLEMRSLLGWQEGVSSVLEQLKRPLRAPAHPVPW